MDWQRLFKPHILERGLNYYENGCVEDYHQGDGVVKAKVRGARAYHVRLDLKDGEILEMECDCPYAQDGNSCKHMAAALFYRDEEAPVRRKGEAPDPEDSAEKLVSEADETAVRDFLTAILESDEKLLGRFKRTLRREVSRKDLKQYNNRIETIVRGYARAGFIDYFGAASFSSELEDFLDNDVEPMLANRLYPEAFELTGHVFAAVSGQDIDDSDGEAGALVVRCAEIWREILAHCDRALKRRLFRWFLEQLDGRAINYTEEIEGLLFESFPEEEFLRDKLTFTEEKARASGNEPDSWLRGYYAGKWAVLHIGVMRELHASQDSIDAYVEKNLEFSAVRSFYVQDCLKRERYDAAIRALEDGKEADHNAPGLVTGYSLQLKELYRLTGRPDAYERELWLLMLRYQAGNPAIYKELKTLYTGDEWARKRELLFKKLPPHTEVGRLYAEDGLWDRLLKLVLSSGGLRLLTTYESRLKKLYPEELLAKYETEVTQMAARAAGRTHYRELVDLLKRMREYPGGKQKAEEIACGWRSAYKRRPAMMDELKRLPSRSE